MEANLNSSAVTQNLSSWEDALQGQKDIETKLQEEEKRINFEKDKKQYFAKVKALYAQLVQGIESSKSIDEKYNKLMAFNSALNSEKRFPEINQKILSLIQPVYNEVKNVKNRKDTMYSEFRNKLSTDLDEIEGMINTNLQRDVKLNFVNAFKDKWNDYKVYIDKTDLISRYEKVVRFGQ